MEIEVAKKSENLFFRRFKERLIPKLIYKRVIEEEFGKAPDKDKNYKHIRSFYDTQKKDEYTVDDQSWNDFDMDLVLGNIDKAYSSLGEGVLYSMLRNPIMDKGKLKEREKLINFFISNKKVRTDIQYRFLMLGRDKKNTFLDMMTSEVVKSRLKYFLYTFLGKILPIVLFLLAMYNERFAPLLIGWMMINLCIYEREKFKISSNGIYYLREMIDTSKKLAKIKENNLSKYAKKLQVINKDLKSIDNKTKVIKFINMWGRTFEFLAIPFLLEETTYYKIAPKLNRDKEKILKLYEALGELEALISVASYKLSLNNNYTTPIFCEDVILDIEEGYHPLLKNSVKNSINIKDKGVILTGTNMSGKSTFLRMLGINIILAQSFYFVLAKKYRAPFLNVVSSIAPKDDLESGNSFYLAEAKSVLRVINSLDKKIPVFCPIDEIFRGTNPVERIASSGEILKYINGRNSISIVSTHDRELIDILKKDFEFYYFSESVKNNSLSFDYKIRKGVSHTRNAIKLLEVIGYDLDIIEKSYAKARELDEKIGLKNI